MINFEKLDEWLELTSSPTGIMHITEEEREEIMIRCLAFKGDISYELDQIQSDGGGMHGFSGLGYIRDGG